MSEIAKASDHIKPCNIEQSERHNRRDADYIASLNPRILYVRTDLTHNNESYVAPDMKGISLQQHYDAIKVLVKQKTGRKMQEKKVPYVAKSGKTKERNGSSPIRESVVNIKPDTTMDDLQKYTERVHERWGVRAIQIHIHRDEGHFENPDDPSTWKPNLHAHIIWDWMNHETGKSFKLDKKDMEQLQDMAAETLEMERGQRKAETGREHLERTDLIIQKQEEKKQKNQKELEEQKAEIEKLAQASMFDKLLNSGLSPAVRKAMEDEQAAHEEELRQVTTAHDKDGDLLYWVSDDKNDKPLTWEEYAKCLEEEKQELAAMAQADKEAAVQEAKNEAKQNYDAAIAEMKASYDQKLQRASLAFDKNGNPIMKDFGLGNRQQITKVERIEMLEKELSDTKKANNDLLDRLKVLRDLIFAFCSLNFKKVVKIIFDQWKRGLKEFTKDLKDIIQEAVSGEKTVKGRQNYVIDAFQYAKMMAKTDPDYNLNFEDLKPLHEDAMRIADGTWDSYHEKVEKREELFDAAVKAVIEMGNCSFQRHLNQEQANTIEAFLAFDGGDRNQLCVDIWNKAKPQVEYYWQDGTLSALEELRRKDLYGQNYSHGRGRSV
jgi:hypothetical protein